MGDSIWKKKKDEYSGKIEDVLNSSPFGTSRFSWGAVILSLGLIWACWGIVSALLYFF